MLFIKRANLKKGKKEGIASSVVMEAQPTTKHERKCLSEIITPGSGCRR